MRKVKSIKIKDMEGKECQFRLTQISTTDSMKLMLMGVTSGVTTIMPKLAQDEELQEKLTIIIMKNVEKRVGKDEYIPLKTMALIDNHIDPHLLYKLADLMIDFSMGFTIAGILQKFLKSITEKVPAITQTILTTFQRSLSEKDTQL